MNMMQIFKELYFARTEDEIEKVINAHPDIFKQGELVSSGSAMKIISAS